MTINDTANIIANYLKTLDTSGFFTVGNVKNGKITLTNITTVGKLNFSSLDLGKLSFLFNDNNCHDASFTRNTTKSNMNIIGTQGDTYFQRYDSLMTRTSGDNDENGIIDITSAMIETHINLDGRTDIDRTTTNLTDIDLDNFGAINDIYTQEDNIQNGMVTDEMFDNDSYQNSILWTTEKHNGDETDAWTHITTASTLALDGDKGKVRALKKFNNILLAFQDRAICEVLFNSRTQLSTEGGVPVEIANTGKVDGKRYITTSYGCTNKWSIADGKAGLYFVDDVNRIIAQFNGQSIDPLSTKSRLDAWTKLKTDESAGLESWLPDGSGNKFVSFYDKKRSEVYFVKWDDNDYPCLVYNEQLGAFSSFYDYKNMPMLTDIGDKLLAYRNGFLWRQNEGFYNKFFGETHPSWITYRARTDSDADAIWTGIEYMADFHELLDDDGNMVVDCDAIIDGSEMSIDTYKPDDTFSSIEVWNEHQRTGEFSPKWDMSAGCSYPDVRKKFRRWRMDIPRALKNDAGNKYGLDRIRNPWIYMKLKKDYTDGKQLMHLHDVIVKHFTNG